MSLDPSTSGFSSEAKKDREKGAMLGGGGSERNVPRQIGKILEEIKSLKNQISGFERLTFHMMRNISIFIDKSHETGRKLDEQSPKQQPPQQIKQQQQQVSEKPPMSACGFKTADDDGWPDCEKKMEWMKSFWKSDACYKNYGVSDDLCSQRIYLANVEQW